MREIFLVENGFQETPETSSFATAASYASFFPRSPRPVPSSLGCGGPSPVYPFLASASRRLSPTSPAKHVLQDLLHRALLQKTPCRGAVQPSRGDAATSSCMPGEAVVAEQDVFSKSSPRRRFRLKGSSQDNIPPTNQSSLFSSSHCTLPPPVSKKPEVLFPFFPFQALTSLPSRSSPATVRSVPSE